MKYNADESDLYSVANRTNKAFDKAMKAIRKHGFHTPGSKSKRKSFGSGVGSAKRGKTPIHSRGVSVDQKARFCKLMYSVNEYQLGSIVELLNKICPDCLTKKRNKEEDDYGEEEVEINIDLIDINSFRAAEAALKKQIAANERKAK